MRIPSHKLEMKLLSNFYKASVKNFISDTHEELGSSRKTRLDEEWFFVKNNYYEEQVLRRQHLYEKLGFSSKTI
ncbi:hypothetical protein HanIR_Chr14g0671111 [Helianthus annuus]|nr:hypothetical protein HanIR_Chr14g0671111 [Helianthus annuus]